MYFLLDQRINVKRDNTFLQRKIQVLNLSKAILHQPANES